MKQKYTTLAVAAVLAAVGPAVGKVPEIDQGRIDSMVAQVLQQADGMPGTQRPDGAAIRKNVILQLQTAEVLKNEAFTAGLHKDAEVQNQFKNVEAQFYAMQYALYLERNTETSEAELREGYDRQTRVVKLQQVYFATAEEARKAQELLLKGLSFDGLIKRYPNSEQGFSDFIPQQQLAPEMAKLVGGMTRGQVSREPVEMNGKFYLFKLAALERNPEAPPFEQVKPLLAQQVKQQKVQEQIEKILKENGIGG
ncbi:MULTISPECIES: peptidyl-prolyl cis-trans isomerase [unclassified Neisseria]|uniref:peptidylprolyl isomerase n=1 Tax=unclassified Neisseria TaxID=2623750 RepID=UPI001071E1D3|nr:MULTISPECIES: peptidylprolyl isomerase [unclassified Neisseria]MBF0802813.1 peptidyl-prolyl cis-trans isomerase [Neisseria sp. 19428wB4_WF04]TFU44607.1 peptidyl-prolyl cis-trans isomerase [Neisseria sp. WF04]